jgi:hypothetical protein
MFSPLAGRGHPPIGPRILVAGREQAPSQLAGLLRQHAHAVRGLGTAATVLGSNPLCGQRGRELDDAGGGRGSERRGDTCGGGFPGRGKVCQGLPNALSAELGHRPD